LWQPIEKISSSVRGGIFHIRPNLCRPICGFTNLRAGNYKDVAPTALAHPSGPDSRPDANRCAPQVLSARTIGFFRLPFVFSSPRIGFDCGLFVFSPPLNDLNSRLFVFFRRRCDLIWHRFALFMPLGDLNWMLFV
jgi:hypothetical protein